MRTLFLRIFLSFWAAMLLVLLATAAVAWYRFSQVETLDLNALAPQASERLHKDGLEGLRSWIFESQEKYIGRNIFVVDYTGVDILGRTLPDRLTSYVRRLERAGLMSKGVPRDREPNPLLLTPQFFDRDDSVYTLMVESSAGPWGVLNTPNMRAVLVVFALAISGLVCWWLARYVSKPVERLQSSVRSLAAGNLDSRVGDEFSRRHDELGVLARDFDVMADHVRALIASKESLLPALSHELRSPLTRIRMGLELMQGGQPSPAFRAEIERNITELDQLVDEILLASRLDAGAADVGTVEPVDLVGLAVEECVRVDAELQVGAGGADDDGAATIEVPGVSKLLRRAVRNLLENARRYSQGEVTLHITREGRTAVLRVCDHGPGVPPEQRERIFEPFYRLPGASERSGGVGLGLALVRSIAAAPWRQRGL